jgi:predicted N-acetyltransferase YhbS
LTNVFFIKKEKEIAAFGLLIPVKVKHLEKDYNIFGIGSIIAIQKGKGYGKKLIQAMIDYLKKKGKTGLGFCSRENMRFYEKSGIATQKNLIRKFRYKNPKTGEIIKDNDGDGFYYNGKDNLIPKILSTRLLAYINISFW